MAAKSGWGRWKVVYAILFKYESSPTSQHGIEHQPVFS